MADKKTKEKRREGQELDRGSVRSPPAGSVRSPPAGKGKGLGFRSQGPPLGEAQKGQRRPAGRKRTEPAGGEEEERETAGKRKRERQRRSAGGSARSPPADVSKTRRCRGRGGSPAPEGVGGRRQQGRG